jgi:hypothetical protein
MPIRYAIWKIGTTPESLATSDRPPLSGPFVMLV